MISASCTNRLIRGGLVRGIAAGDPSRRVDRTQCSMRTARIDRQSCMRSSHAPRTRNPEPRVLKYAKTVKLNPVKPTQERCVEKPRAPPRRSLLVIYQRRAARPPCFKHAAAACHDLRQALGGVRVEIRTAPKMTCFRVLAWHCSAESLVVVRGLHYAHQNCKAECIYLVWPPSVLRSSV